ncbi:MAG: hypothetical protein GY838_20040 [bacterium]|nr:hypothetical protein [bacterium]
MKTSLLLLAVLLWATAALIDHPAQVVTSRSKSTCAGTAPGHAGVDPVRPTPYQQQIRAVVDSARTAEAELLAELGAGASPDHPAVQQLRRTTTNRLLEIQARYAAARGRYGLERRIRANMAELRAERPAEPTLARRDD